MSPNAHDMCVVPPPCPSPPLPLPPRRPLTSRQPVSEAHLFSPPPPPPHLSLQLKTHCLPLLHVMDTVYYLLLPFPLPSQALHFFTTQLHPSQNVADHCIGLPVGITAGREGGGKGRGRGKGGGVRDGGGGRGEGEGGRGKGRGGGGRGWGLHSVARWFDSVLSVGEICPLSLI